MKYLPSICAPNGVIADNLALDSHYLIYFSHGKNREMRYLR